MKRLGLAGLAAAMWLGTPQIHAQTADPQTQAEIAQLRAMLEQTQRQLAEAQSQINQLRPDAPVATTNVNVVAPSANPVLNTAAYRPDPAPVSYDRPLVYVERLADYRQSAPVASRTVVVDNGLVSSSSTTTYVQSPTYVTSPAYVPAAPTYYESAPTTVNNYYVSRPPVVVRPAFAPTYCPPTVVFHASRYHRGPVYHHRPVHYSHHGHYSHRGHHSSHIRGHYSSGGRGRGSVGVGFSVRF